MQFFSLKCIIYQCASCLQILIYLLAKGDLIYISICFFQLCRFYTDKIDYAQLNDIKWFSLTQFQGSSGQFLRKKDGYLILYRVLSRQFHHSRVEHFVVLQISHNFLLLSFQLVSDQDGYLSFFWIKYEICIYLLQAYQLCIQSSTSCCELWAIQLFK